MGGKRLKEHDRQCTEDDIRKLLGEPKWVFLQTIYSRVVFIVTHFAFDKMERIKMTELNSYRHFVVQFYSSKV